MSDIVTLSGLYHQAYRTYASEEGHDPAIGKSKASEISTQTASVAEKGISLSLDTLSISPEAAHMYLDSLKKRKSVTAKPDTAAQTSTDSATAELEDNLPTEKEPFVDSTTDSHRPTRNSANR